MRAQSLAAEGQEARTRPGPAPAPSLGVAHFVRGLTALGLGQLASWAGSAVTVVLMPRYLGAAGLGRYSLVFSVIGVFSILSDLGISTFQAKEVAKDPARARELYVPAMAVRLALALAVALLAALAFHLLSADPVIQLTGYVALGMIVIGAFQGSYATLQGLHRAPLLSASTTISAVAAAALTAVVLLRGGGPVACAAAAVAAAAISQGVTTALLLRHVRPRWSLAPRLMWRIARGGTPFMLWSAALTAYSQIDVVMLNVMTRPDVVGWYAAAQRLVGIPVFAPTLVLTIGFPVLAASASHTVAFSSVARQILRAIMLVSLPLALGLAILPQDVTRLLGFPATFSNSWVPLQLLALQFPLVAADMVIGSALNARDRQRQWTLAALSAAFLNPLANLWAIPFTQHVLGNGAVGAAAVTGLTELYLMGVGLWLLPRDVFRWADAGMVARVLAACVPMSIVAYLLSGSFIAIPVLAGGVVYAAAALATRVLSIQDLRSLWLVLPGRKRGQGRGAEVTGSPW